MSRLTLPSTIVTSVSQLRRPTVWRSMCNLQVLTAVAVFVGCCLRLAAWWSNRSFWLDEIYLALNLTQRSIFDLCRPLDYDQGAPLGFLVLVKSTTYLFGTSELVLRLVPLAAGIGAVVLFPVVARRWLPQAGACFAVVLFAVAPKSIHYSSELKQYSSDVFVTVVFLWLMTMPHRVWTLAFAGAVAIWFSHPIVFVLAAGGLCLWWQGDAEHRRRLVFVGLIWMLSFAICYWISLRALAQNHYLLDFWTEYFAPVMPRNFEQAGWYLRAIGWLMEGPMGMMVADISFAIPAILLFSAGLWWALRDRPTLAAMILGPLFLTLLASMMHRYPFGGRLLLFAVPLVCLGLGAGWQALRPAWRDPSSTMCLGLCCAVAFAPLASSVQQTLQRKTAEDHRAAMYYLAKKWQAGDAIYLSSMARAPFLYYGGRQGIPATAIVGQPKRDDWDHVNQDIQRIKGRDRLWVFVAHERGANHQFTTWQLDQHGRRLSEFNAPGVALYMYDLRNVP